MAKRRVSQRKPPEIIVISEVSKNPGSPEELDEILLRWEMALMRKAKVLLELEAEQNQAQP